MSHSAFLSFIVLLATLGGVAQATRAGTYSNMVEQRIAHLHMECSNLINSRVSFEKDRDGRVQHFLKTRDPSGNGLRETEEETYRTILRPEEVRENERLRTRGDDDTSDQ